MPVYLQKWLSPKTVRFWAVVAVLLYTLCGFFLLPRVLHSQLESRANETLGRELTIGKVRVNPYVLSLQIDDFSFQDTDGQRLFGFDQFFVNLQASSLFRGAWTFKEIRLDITDNGQGLPTEQLAHGNGLRNMEKRMQAIGGTFHL